MQTNQIYTGCLAQSAYSITGNGEAAFIDPLPGETAALLTFPKKTA